MKKIFLSVLGEKFEIELEDEFFEFVKEDLLKIQNPTPKELLFLMLKNKKELFETNKKIKNLISKLEKKMKKAFTMIELIFVIVILGILASVAIPRYFALGQASHEANLISFVRTLNRTTGEDLWAKSISGNKHGSIVSLASAEDADFLVKYIDIPVEINASSINLSNCGNGVYQTIMTANVEIAGKEYNITCKDGTATSAPYFRLIRNEDNEVLVSRD